MKRTLLTFALGLAVAPSLLAQCDAEVGVPVPPVETQYCPFDDDTSQLQTSGYSTDPEDGLIPAYIIAYRGMGEAIGDAPIVGVTYDGTWDFENNSNPLTDDGSYPQGEYVFIPSVVDQDDLNAVTSDPVVQLVIPFDQGAPIDVVINDIITNQTVLELIGVTQVTPNDFYNVFLPTLLGLVAVDEVCINSDYERAYSIELGCDVSTSMLNAASANLFPNPATDFATLEFDALETTTGQIEVFDLTGRRVSLETVDVFNGRNAFTVSTVDFVPGTYLVNLTVGEDVISKRLSVQK